MINVNPKSTSLRTGGFQAESNGYYSGMVSWRVTLKPNTWRPLTDVYETEENIIVRVEIAGMSEGDFKIEIDQSLLSISGVRTDTPERRAYHQMEINYGEFRTEVEIMIPIDPENITAEYGDGFLIVQLPKAAPRQIRISQD